LDNVDIYFEEAYAKLSQIIEQGTAEYFHHHDQDGEISYVFIKRKIPQKIDNREYYDITTPYGYGGPVIRKLTGNHENLVNSFNSKFSDFCRKENIVSEFVRFHPIINNQATFRGIYQTMYMRPTIGTDLTKSDHPEISEFSKSTKTAIRRAYRQGFTWEIVPQPVDLSNFIKLYFNTMDRQQAVEFYYFDQDYFQSMLELVPEHIVNINIYLADTCVTSGLYFIYNQFMHEHLSATHSEYLHLGPAYLLKDIAVQWAKQQGIDLVHYGGGTSNAPDDALLFFKRRFSQTTEFEFHIGTKIHNPEVYKRLTDMTSTGESNFFPTYRAI